MAEKYGKKVKELMVKEITDAFKGNEGFIFSEFDNVKATEIDEFRKKMRQSGTKYFLLKKRIGRIALKEAELEEMADIFEERQNIGVGVIKEDPVKIAKLMMEFSKKNKNFKIANGYLEGNVITAEKVKELAQLPGREQLLAMVLSMMNAPITGFVGVLSSIVRSLCYALNAIKEKKETSQ